MHQDIQHLHPELIPLLLRRAAAELELARNLRATCNLAVKSELKADHHIVHQQPHGEHRCTLWTIAALRARLEDHLVNMAKCTNTSCGKEFDPAANGPQDCAYHPGGPVSTH
jgi:hypothetical protein